jgi:hypothetical protein
LLDGMARSRVVEIDSVNVTITDQTLFGMRSISVPLKSYTGLVHHVRASLSGLRHELILAHAESDHSVLITHADRIGQSEIDRVCGMLGHREVASGHIYRLTLRRPRPASPAAELAKAA